MAQCQFVIVRKQRRCRMQCQKGADFCAEHVVAGDPGAAAKQSTTRIACPLDPHHTVEKAKLKAHLAKCNKTKLKEAPKREPWFSQDINAIRGGPPRVLETSNGVSEPKVPFEMNYKLLDRVEAAFAQLDTPELPLQRLALENKAIEARLSELGNQKHILQQSSLLGHMEKHRLFGKEFDYVEFGCGRAELTRWLASALAHVGEPEVAQPQSNEAFVAAAQQLVQMTQKTEVAAETKETKEPAESKEAQKASSFPEFYLIDRSPVRLKLDSKIPKDLAPFGVNPQIHRFKADIKDYDVAKAISDTTKSRGPRLVALSKHLCGCATDLTLECISRNKSLFEGAVMAMCCRHVCDYHCFLPEGLRYLKDLFNATDNEMPEIFTFLTKIVSWATCGTRADNETRPHKSGLDFRAREAFGFKARRLVDEARRHAMTQRGFEAHLVRYVDLDVSLESTCLVLTRKTGTSGSSDQEGAE